MKTAVATVCLSLVALESSAGLYKCTSEDGKITYSQTECPDGVIKELHVSKSPADTPLNDVDDLTERCMTWIRAGLNDPYSAVAEPLGGLHAQVIRYKGVPLLVYELVVNVNAKNSYGGYTGYEPYYCYLSQNDQEVLSVERYPLRAK